MGTLNDFFEDLKQVKETVKVKPKPKRAKPKATQSNVYVEELPEITKDDLCPVCGQRLGDLTYAVANLTYVSQTTLEEKVEMIRHDDEFWIQPYPQEHSHFGGCAGGFREYGDSGLKCESVWWGGSVRELLQHLIEWRRWLFALPYTENLTDSDRFTNLKPEHVFINVSEGTRKWIADRMEGSWDDFLKEWNSIDVRPVPDGYMELVDREHELEGEYEKVKKEVEDIEWGFKGYSGCSRYDLEHPNGIRMAIENLHKLEELLPIKIRVKNQLEDVKEEIEEMLEGDRDG